MTCQQQLSVRSSAGVLEAPSGYALRCLQDIKAKRTVYLLRNRTILFATNSIHPAILTWVSKIGRMRASCQMVFVLAGHFPDTLAT